MSKTVYFEGAVGVSCKKLSAIRYGQDGVIKSGLIFRMEMDGMCYVFHAETFAPVAEFPLDKRELICPHSNAVCFGADYYEEGDEFPLLYTNIYNNYERKPERHEGTVCVYRITRDGDGFASQLVQVIEVGFMKTSLWSSENGPDVRPFGNFVIDEKGRELVGFTMRDEARKTRFFRFQLPDFKAGELDEAYGVNKLTLTEADVIDYFDIEYMHYMQGATCYDGYIYSSEGFDQEINPARLRIIDIKGGREVLNVNLRAMGFPREAELIDVYEGKTYYSDNHGDLFAVEFV